MVRNKFDFVDRSQDGYRGSINIIDQYEEYFSTMCNSIEWQSLTLYIDSDNIVYFKDCYDNISDIFKSYSNVVEFKKTNGKIAWFLYVN